MAKNSIVYCFWNELQIFKCFGCGKSGDIFTFVQEYERLIFAKPLIELAGIAGIVLKKVSSTINKILEKVLMDLNTQVGKFYQYMLNPSIRENALDYVLKRGISLATIKQFGLGFSENPAIAANFLTKKAIKFQI